MRLTVQLQGLRLMKFEDVYGRCYRGDLSQVEAPEILGGFGATARTLEEIGRAARVALASNQPALVQVPVRSVLSPYMDYVTR